MRLIWKLLREHISIAQFVGYFFANLLGMTIILLGIQFYRDVIPMFTDNDSFIKEDYLIVNKKVSTLGALAGKNTTFTQKEIEELAKQPFTKKTGFFTSSHFKISAGIGTQKNGPYLSTDLFFESVPDEYIDIRLDKWSFDETSNEIPIIIPRNYLNLYNFGFAQSQNLPKLSEGVIGMVKLDIDIMGNGRRDEYRGNIVGFSNRLNTILVPQQFMDYANNKYAPGSGKDPARLILEVSNPADDRILHYFQQQGYETEENRLNSSKTVYFLRIVTGVILVIGAIVCLLSFYILILSIYLLVEKNSTKLKNLLLLGYTTFSVALPYQLLSLSLNLIILIFSLGILTLVRQFYQSKLVLLVPQHIPVPMGLTLFWGIIIGASVTVLNFFIINRKVFSTLPESGSRNVMGL